MHALLLVVQIQPEAAGFVLRGIEGVFVAIGSILAAFICAGIAAVKGRNPPRFQHLG